MNNEIPEKRPFVSQRRAKIAKLIAANSAILAVQGSVVQFRRGAQRQFGPYWQLMWRDQAGRQRTLYLGADAELVAEVRQKLAELQVAKERRLLARARKAARRELRKTMRALEGELSRLGLCLHGTEIRGLRNARV